MKCAQRGFTLIELLVVIAIIGLLSSVVLASLNSARNRGGDAAVKSNLNTVRSQAEIYYSISNSYRPNGGGGYAGNCITTGTVFRDTTNSAEHQSVSAVIASAIAAAVAAGNGGVQCRIDGGQNYVIFTRLKTSNNYWCIDSRGSAKDIGTSLPAAGVLQCP